MFHPMAFTVIIALLSAMVLSLTFRASGRGAVRYGQGLRKEKPHHERRRMAVQTSVASLAAFSLVDGRSSSLYPLIGGAGWLASTTMGSEFIPQLDEG